MSSSSSSSHSQLGWGSSSSPMSPLSSSATWCTDGGATLDDTPTAFPATTTQTWSNYQINVKVALNPTERLHVAQAEVKKEVFIVDPEPPAPTPGLEAPAGDSSVTTTADEQKETPTSSDSLGFDPGSAHPLHELFQRRYDADRTNPLSLRNLRSTNAAPKDDLENASMQVRVCIETLRFWQDEEKRLREEKEAQNDIKERYKDGRVPFPAAAAHLLA
jgi:hypothetical protein